MLKDRHGGQTARSHGHEGELVGTAVRVHGVEVRARDVHATEHQRRRDVALVLEKHLLEQRHGRHHTGFGIRVLQAERL